MRSKCMCARSLLKSVCVPTRAQLRGAVVATVFFADWPKHISFGDQSVNILNFSGTANPLMKI